jgi:ubiquinone/menaquinone biosynthesis C-methylase UbiE
MEDLNQKELEKTAAAYEELLVPALFSEWANRLANSDEVKAARNILDVACGTGVVARTIAGQLKDGSVSGLDPNPWMLAVAREKAPDIKWYQGQAEELPFEDETFDAIVSQFGMMFFTSPETALKEMNRVLQTGGHMMVTVFDSLQNIPAYDAMVDVFDQKVGKSAGEALRYPFTMGDTEKLYALCSESGLSNAEIVTQKSVAQFSNPRHMVLSDVEGWFPFAKIHLEDRTLESVVSEAESVLKPFTTSDGAVQFDISVHIIKAQKS